jgi:hypothetical protein
MGDLFYFERRQSVGAVLAGASVTKTATLLGVSRVVVSKVTRISQQQPRGRVAENNISYKVIHWKRLFRKISEQLNILESWRLCFHKKVYNLGFSNPLSTVVLQLINLWLLKALLRCVNSGVTTMKPGYETAGDAWYGRMCHYPSHYFSITWRVDFWRTHNPEYLVPTLEDKRCFVIVRAAVLYWSYYCRVA